MKAGASFVNITKEFSKIELLNLRENLVITHLYTEYWDVLLG